MPTVGPGAVQEIDSNVQPLLNGASEYEYITILNPLTDDFAIRVAQDIPINMPFQLQKPTESTQSGNDVVRNYGLNLKNPDFVSRKHITNDVVIKSGQTLNLKGNEAQVAVKQIVNELMQREGNGRLLSDPTLRREAEQRVVIKRGSIQDLMDNNLQTTRDQLNSAIDQSNEVQANEPTVEFPELNRPIQGDAEGSSDAGANDTAPEKRAPGRPKKAD